MDQNLTPLVIPEEHGCSNKVVESLDRLDDTLKLLEKNCNGKDAEVWNKPRQDGRKVSPISLTVGFIHYNVNLKWKLYVKLNCSWLKGRYGTTFQ